MNGRVAAHSWTSRLLPISALVLASVTLAAHQQRDVRPVPTGTGEISGIVWSGTPRQPVRRAVVTISSADLPDARSVITDDAGRFFVRPAASRDVHGHGPEGRPSRSQLRRVAAGPSGLADCARCRATSDDRRHVVQGRSHRRHASQPGWDAARRHSGRRSRCARQSRRRSARDEGLHHGRPRRVPDLRLDAGRIRRRRDAWIHRRRSTGGDVGWRNGRHPRQPGTPPESNGDRSGRSHVRAIACNSANRLRTNLLSRHAELRRRGAHSPAGRRRARRRELRREPCPCRVDRRDDRRRAVESERRADQHHPAGTAARRRARHTRHQGQASKRARRVLVRLRAARAVPNRRFEPGADRWTTLRHPHRPLDPAGAARPEAARVEADRRRGTRGNSCSRLPMSMCAEWTSRA